MNPRNWAWTARGGFIAAAVVLVIAMISGIIAMATSNNEPRPSAPAIAAPERIDPVTGLPIVDGGNPAEPIDGNTSNADSRTPVVRGGSIVTNWAGLDALLGTDTSYTGCVSKTTGMNWGSDVPKFKQTESAINDPRYILAVNTTASDEAVRKIASDSAGENLSGLQILRVDSIVNTRGFKTGSCQEFLDRRSTVRVSLGKFVYNNDGSVKGLQTGTGVFVDCHNPWRLPTTSVPPAHYVPPTTVPPTTTPPTTTPTLEKKNPSLDPAAQGNAPVGGGKNVNPGPGVYVPPTSMVQPPAAPYTAPAAPKVTTKPVGSTSDPATAPAPQKSAPPATAPATGCAPAPGTTC